MSDVNLPCVTTNLIHVRQRNPDHIGVELGPPVSPREGGYTGSKDEKRSTLTVVARMWWGTSATNRMGTVFAATLVRG